MNELGISVVLPAYNESEMIARTVARVAAVLARQTVPTELVVVDDGSADDTAQRVAAAAAQTQIAVRCVAHGTNRGLATALRTGIAAATYAAIVVLDADLSYEPELIEPLARPILEDVADVTVASPYMRGGRASNVPVVRLAISRIANALLSLRVGRQVSTLTGMVRGYRAQTIRAIVAEDPVGEINSWILLCALRRGARVVEIPAHLCWPPERVRGAPRMSARKLVRATRAVLRTLRNSPRA